MSFWKKLFRRALQDTIGHAGWDNPGKIIFKLVVFGVLTYGLFVAGNLIRVIEHLGGAIGTVVAAGSAFALVFVANLARALPRLAKEADERFTEERKAIQTELASLQERMRPRIRVFIDPVNSGVLEIPTELIENGKVVGDGPSSKWIQFCVECATETPLRECEARVTSFARLNDDGSETELEPEHVHCSWSMLNDQRITIRPMIKQAANLITLYDNATEVSLQLRPPHIALRRALQFPGQFRVEVVVAASGAPSVRKQFRLEQYGYNRVSIVEFT